MKQRRLHLPEAWSLVPRAGGEIELRGATHHYLARVLRLQRGQPLVLFNGEGQERLATLELVGREELQLYLGPSRDAALPEARTPVALLVGLTRGSRLDAVLRQLTELGLAEFWPVICARSVSLPPAARRSSRQQRWQRISADAARQCGRAATPRVLRIQPLDDAIRGLLRRPEMWSLRLVAQPGVSGGLWQGLRPEQGGVALLVGPEGGFCPAELDRAFSAGFVPFGMGCRVLRAGTAAVVALALVQQRLGEL